MVRRIASVDETFRFPVEVRAALAELLSTNPAAPLGICYHNPTIQAEYSQPTTNMFTAFAPALLAVTFTAPASGNVFVDMEAEISNLGGRGYWAVMTGGVTRCPTFVAAAPGRGRARVYVDGLTPGQSYDFQWAGAHSAGSFNIRAGGTGSLDSANSGPATMAVWATT